MQQWPRGARCGSQAPGQAGARTGPTRKGGISWSAAAGTAYYDIYFLADDGSGDWLFHTITNETSAATPPISYVGPAHLTVKAIGPLATGSQGSFVTPISQASVNLSFTH